MHEGWRTAPIGDVVVRSDERLGRSAEPTILTCTEGTGLIRQADKFKKRIAAADTSLYKVVRRGDVVYNPYLLWKGAIAQSDYDEMCITSPVYEVLRPVEGVDTRYVGLALTSRGVVSLFDALSIGSIERRRRAVLPAVLDVPIDLPPSRSSAASSTSSTPSMRRPKQVGVRSAPCGWRIGWCVRGCFLRRTRR